MHTPQAPGPLMPGRFYLTSSLGTIILPRDWSITERLPASRPSVSITGRDGAVPVGRRSFGVRTGTLTGELAASPGMGDDAIYAILWPPEPGSWGWGPNNTQVDALLRVLQGSPVRLRKDDPEGRFLDIEVTQLQPTELSFARSRFSVNWEAQHPFWASHETSVSEGAGTGTQFVTVRGNAPVHPLVTVTGPAVNPRIQNMTNGTSLQYLGTLNAGNELVLDCGRAEAWRSAVSVLGSMDGAFALGFQLESGENELVITTDSGTPTVRVEWRDQWY